mmetsp:Transcript_21862/g.54154  ORF Transcript_21862/g.54154 Transcript_21862/m.54154 type:complete len:118 (-) Transcript_21862:205-558(-)
MLPICHLHMQSDWLFESTQSTSKLRRCYVPMESVIITIQYSSQKEHRLTTSTFSPLTKSDRFKQYVNRAAGSVRSALKEPMKSKLLAQSEFKYNASAWEAGVQGAKKEVTSLSQAGK